MMIVAFFSCTKESKEKMDENTSNQENNIVELSAREQVLVNLKMDTVKNKTIYEMTTLLGKATVDVNKINVISSRVKGRVDKLFVRNTGEEIKNGEALYSIICKHLINNQNLHLKKIY